MSENAIEIPEEIQVAVIGDFLQTAAGQGVQTLIQLTVAGMDPRVRLNAALALTGLYDQFALEVDYGYNALGDGEYVDTYAEAEDRVAAVYADAYTEGEELEEFDAGLVTGDSGEGASPDAPEGTITTEEALARLQALQASGQAEADEGAGSMGGASGIGPRNPRATRKRRKHGRR